MLYEQIVSKEKSIAVIGLGYVGLPIALAFAKKVKVIGFDINADRIKQMQSNIDPSGELSSADFEGADIVFTDSLEVLKQANFFIVAVPTPIDAHQMPDLSPLIKASESVGKVLKKGDYVVYESTVYPGCTEEDCVPILEKHSGLTFRQDFMVGYSPERINPGDKEHTIEKIVKVVSGCCAISLEIVAQVYELIIEAGVYRASSIKVAEAAKIIENTQRDLNIALMNELSQIFNKMQINTYEVLKAAGTKWNFLKFYPGLVGGHCIGVDPYYLTYKAKAIGFDPKVILSGRAINDGMGVYVAKNLVQMLAKNGITNSNARVLVMGATFKENVEDIRNSKIVDVISELTAFGVHVDIVDPYANPQDFAHEYGFSLSKEPAPFYHAVLVGVAHKQYATLDQSYFKALLHEGKGILFDLKGLYLGKVSDLHYWTL